MIRKPFHFEVLFLESTTATMTVNALKTTCLNGHLFYILLK